MSMMKNSEYRRLMAYSQAKRIHKQHQERTAPSKRTSKHPGVGAVFKHSRIVSEPMERLFISPNHYKSVNAVTTLHQYAS